MTQTDPSDAALTTLSDRIAKLDNVKSVDPAVRLKDGHVLLSVRFDLDDPGGKEGSTVVKQIRDLDSTLLVSGEAAGQIDFADALRKGTPLAAVLVIAGDVRAAVPHDRIPARTGQGLHHQRHLDRRVARHRHLDLHQGTRVRDDRAGELHRRARGGVRVRPGDGLRGLPARPRQGAVRHGPRQRRGRTDRAPADRAASSRRLRRSSWWCSSASGRARCSRSSRSASRWPSWSSSTPR